MTDIAGRIYDGWFAKSEFEDKMFDLCADKTVDHWEGERYDHYDDSFEFYKCAPGFRLNEKQIAYFVECGFARCWLNHTDGSETYYYISVSDGLVKESRKEPTP